MRTRQVLLFFVVLVGARAAQSAADASLEKKVRAELELVYFDTLPPYKPLDQRLLALGESSAVSAAVLEIVQKDLTVLSLIERNQNPRPGVPYNYLINGIRVLGALKERHAVPLLTELAEYQLPSDTPSNSLDVKLQAVLAIGELDASGNKALLLEALKDRNYAVRRAAAQGLSRIDDPSVLTELEVAASQEPYRDTSKEIQGMADALRMSAKPK